MIHVLAQIVSHQIRTPKEGIRDEPDPPPPRCPNVEQAPSISRANSSTQASSHVEISAPNHWQESSAQALVVLLTELAQRRVQAARVQEDIHEYSSHHHSPSRTDGVRLRASIYPVASP